MDQPRRLYRSESDRLLAGVCGGVGVFFGVDPTIVRILFVLLAFSGVGVLLYLAMWVIVPRESRIGAHPSAVTRDAADEIRDAARRGVDEARNAYQRWRGTDESIQ